MIFIGAGGNELKGRRVEGVGGGGVGGDIIEDSVGQVQSAKCLSYNFEQCFKRDILARVYRRPEHNRRKNPVDNSGGQR